MKKILEITKTDENWIEGIYKGYNFLAKIFDEGSQYGINEGRISKLWIKDEYKNKVIFNYDRGIDLDSPIGYELAKVLEETV